MESDNNAAPIGVFDSGIGGLSVLRRLLHALPHERFVYFADSAHAPYGERGDAYVTARSRAVCAQLRREYAIKTLVIACNTATAAAIEPLRAEHADLPIVGIEPALKPAAAASATGCVGVLATRATLGSEKFAQLLAGQRGRARFFLHACDGLADAIEHAQDVDDEHVRRLLEMHLNALRDVCALGHAAGQIDTLVLGCTHYPLVTAMWQAAIGDAATLLDPAHAVARRTAAVLAQTKRLNPRALPAADRVTWSGSGAEHARRAAVIYEQND